MEEHLAVGYMRIRENTSLASPDLLRQQMVAYAADRGLILKRVLVDSGESAHSAFADLMDALCETGADAVVIPSMDHLARMEGVGYAIKDHIERETNASVLVVTADTKGVA